MTRRMWRTLWRPDVTRQFRSKSFAEEGEAIAWAMGFARAAGPEADVHVYNKLCDEDPDIDPIPRSHRICWANGEMGKISWPELSRADADRQAMRALDCIAEGAIRYAGPPWIRATEAPFVVLQGKAGA